MSEFCFEFEQSPWEITLDRLSSGDTLSAARFLTLLEGETESSVEEAFARMEEKQIRLSVEDLPRDYGCGETEKRLRWEEKIVQSGKLLENLEATDPLRLYLEEVAAIPVAGDPAVLIEEYLAGNESAVQRLVNLVIGRAIESAKNMTGRGVLLMDLIQEASMGLWQGILNYRHGDFDAHMQWWIDQYLSKTVTLQARSQGVGQKLQAALESYRSADRTLLTELGRNPTREEIAQNLGITPEEAEIYEDMLRSAKEAERVKATPEAHPEDEDRPVEDTAYFQSRQRIAEMLSGLTEQQAQVLTMRFGLEGGLPYSPEETGAKLNLTADEVVKIEAEALQILRKEE